MPKNPVPVTVAILFVAVAVSCDLSPTALEEMDPARVDSLLRVAADHDGDPGRRVLYDLVTDSGNAAPAALPQLDSLFELALTTQASTDRERSGQDRQTYRQMLDEAWSKIADGRNSDGEQELAAVRRFQAETVVRVFGAPTALVYGALLDRTIRDATSRLEAGPPGDEKARLEQMVVTIRELRMDAGKAWSSGDAAGSVDIATHAAGLANALARHLAER